MSEYILINRNDPRFTTLKKGFNLRWPTEGYEADFIYICDSAAAVIKAANNALSQGYRMTVRSGGHCYEGFVSNKLQHDGQKPLAIIDLGLMTGLDFSEEKNISSPYGKGEYYRFRAATGNQNWDGYVALYKKANRTIPGGSCYSVGAGGHISGGGYGLLSRLQGLTVDWLTAVDILVPAPDGKSLVAKHVHLNSQGSDRDLFIACRGAGGGNFGFLLPLCATCLGFIAAAINTGGSQRSLMPHAWHYSVLFVKAIAKVMVPQVHVILPRWSPPKA